MESSRARKIKIAWALVIGWSFVIVWILASEDFAFEDTRSWVDELIRFFVPKIKGYELYRLHTLIRKAAHMVEYGILALLALRALLLSIEHDWLRPIGFALLYVFAVATLDESRQSFLDSRTGAAGDVGIDLIGAVIALALWWIVPILWKRLAADRFPIPDSDG